MTEISLLIDQEGPFGIPDGARASIEAPKFVELDAAVTQTGLLSKPEDRTVRVIVGKKGSGKTVYLRRFQAASVDEESLFSIPIDPAAPPSDYIVKFSEWFRADDVTEHWSRAWRAAILRSLSSYLIFEDGLSEYGDRVSRRRLSRVMDELMPEVSAPRTVYNQLTDLISGSRNKHSLEGKLNSPRWGDLEYRLAEVLRTAPPIFFYLDAVDEEYASSPSYWLRCQKGLFYQVMRLLRDPSFGGRLHVVICIRDNVFSSVLRSEHATRYRTDPHIRVLAWDRSAVGYFLEQKLVRLPESYVVRQDRRRDVTSWLGWSTIDNPDRGVNEDIEDYVLRHTRLLPRDVVLVGNALCDEVFAARARGLPAVDDKRIRDVVHRVAAWCGTEQLAICANQIQGELDPGLAARLTRERSEAGFDAYTRHLESRISQALRDVGTDQFDRNTLEALADAGHAAFGPLIDLPNVLWQNGLLGFGDGRLSADEWTFHGVEDVDRFILPRERDRYALHPCVMDAVGMKGGGPGTMPVRPWRAGRT